MLTSSAAGSPLAFTCASSLSCWMVFRLGKLWYQQL